MTAQDYWAHIHNTYYHIPLSDSDHNIPDSFSMPPAIPKLKNTDEEEISSHFISSSVSAPVQVSRSENS